MRIDAHQHFWHYDAIKDAWITKEMTVIRKSFLPNDLRPLLREHQINGCVAVQAAQTEEETDFLLTLANENTFIKGVVGWLDLKNSNLQERIEHYKQFSAFKGVRHILQAEPKGFMTSENFIKGLKDLAQQELTYDILTYESQLEEVCSLLQQVPEMRLVIDHISKPNIKKNSFERWAKYIKELSQYDHLYLKISGMITEADWKNWQPTDLKPYIDFCLEHFGPHRLMYGSDWPVCLLAGSYKKMFQAFEACIQHLSDDEQQSIRGKTAKDFYKL